MGKGQSKEKQKLLDNLPCKDWKVVEKEDPRAIEPLCYWIENYKFNGKLSTNILTKLQQQIKIKCKQNEKQMRKEGYEQTIVWCKIAKQREEGKKLAKQNKEKEKTSEEKQKVIMFHRKEDNEYSGPYVALQQQLQHREEEMGTAAAAPASAPPFTPPKNEQPPQYTEKHTSGPSAGTRSQIKVGDWSHKLTFDPKKVLQPPEEGIYPLIELPNPRAGQDDAGNIQPPTVTVYRTWTQEDIKKAVEGIPHPREDVEECLNQMEDLRLSYHLNGIEVQQVWMCKLGPDWFHVKGGYSPSAPDGPRVADSQDLKDQVTPLLERIKTRYKRRANYTEIGRCKQNSDEPFDEYRVRMEKVFKAHSGLEPGADANGPYQQQLKNALHSGSLPEIHGWVNRNYIGMNGGSLADYINHALHAEKVIKSKKNKKESVFFQTEEENTVYYQQSRGRGRGRDRGRGRRRGNFGTQNPRACWSCGKEGHLARDCQSSNAQPYKST
ncbi:hypothetical protein AMECASPLE_039255 [Ameca splendens]|uniref:CCHC-type domain-containing protein n=1 Tax=Ameca splendens TaxID=208324 RepID=A0ABV0YVH4_9TELE